MKCKIENNKTSYPLISVSNSILVNFMNLATDIGVESFQSITCTATDNQTNKKEERCGVR